MTKIEQVMYHHSIFIWTLSTNFKIFGQKTENLEVLPLREREVIISICCTYSATDPAFRVEVSLSQTSYMI